MSALAVVLVVLAILLALLIAGGLIANARRREAGERGLRADVDAADRALARRGRPRRGVAS